MPKHHSEDYKITAVKHYVNKSKNLSKTCKIFECSRISLKNGFKTYLVDEFRTSCKCSKCEGGDCNKFMIRENPKPYKNNLGLIMG